MDETKQQIDAKMEYLPQCMLKIFVMEKFRKRIWGKSWVERSTTMFKN